MYKLYSTGQTKRDSLTNALSIVDRGLGEITMMRQGHKRSGARAWVEYSVQPEKTAKKQDSKSKKEDSVDVTTTNASKQPANDSEAPKKAKKAPKKAKKVVSKDAGEDITIQND